MPQRSRSHVLEDESFQALHESLPTEWTVTRVQHDYGVDARVEIFDQHHATGLGFLVQLKGTDESDMAQALKTSFKVSSLNYLYAHAEPVLIVRYHAPTRALFGRWLHSKDIFLKHGNQQKVTIMWQPSDRFNAGLSENLQEEVRRFRRFHEPIFSPLTLCVVVSGTWEQSRTSIAAGLESLLSAADSGLTFSDNGPCDVKVELEDDDMRVDLSVTSIHATAVPASSPWEVAANIAVGVATCLARLGRNGTAASLTSAAYGSAPLLDNDDVALRLAPAFGSAGRWREASDLATSSLLGGDNAPDTFGGFLAADLAIRSGQIPPTETQHIGQNLCRIARHHDELGDDRSGAAWYSAANFLFTRAHNYPAALDAYERAACVRPDYLDQIYYVAEIAAAKFENADYQGAAHLYERAACMSADPEFLARQADSLAYVGCRQRALKLFRRYEDASLEPGAAWVLKRAALEYLDGADHESAISSESIAAAGRLIHKAIGINDAARLSDRTTQASDLQAMLQFLTVACAFPAEGTPRMWAYLLRFAHALDDSWTLSVAFEAAWGLHEEGLVPMVVGAEIPDLDDSGFLEVFKEEVSRVRGRPAHPVVLRTLHEDGTRDIMWITDGDHPDDARSGGGKA